MGSRERMAGYLEGTNPPAAGGGHGASPESACRKQLKALLDQESLVELDSRVQSRPAPSGFYREPVPGDGVVTGYGTIDGRLVYVAAQDSTVYGGSVGRTHAEKFTKAIRMARSAGAPFIGLYASGGARIEEGTAALDGLAAILGELEDARGEIPLLAVVTGPCAGGMAMAPALSDFVLFCGPSAGLYMNGPMVIAATEGKEITPEAIGGAAVHGSSTGLASLSFPVPDECWPALRRLLEYLPDNSEQPAHEIQVGADDPNRTDADLDRLAAGMDDGYAMRTVIESVVDRASFLEIRPSYAEGLVTGFARFDGIAAGILANEPAAGGRRMTAAMADKAGSFAAFCDAFDLPLVTLVDLEGFAISVEQEKSSLVGRAASMMAAFARSGNVRVSVLVGKAVGSGALAMNSKAAGADLVYAWPTAEISAASPDMAAHILYRKEIAASPDPAAARSEWAERYAREIASPAAAAASGHVDEIISPSATRPRIVSALMSLTGR